MPLTPEQRSMRARIAAHAKHAKTPPAEATAKARAAFDARFDAMVAHISDPDERERVRAHYLQQYMTQLAFRSSKARKKAS